MYTAVHPGRVIRGLRLIFLFCLVMAVTPVASAAWQWQLPGERYKGLNQFERALYDKAAEALQKQQYGESAALFEKFKIQYPESSELGYVVFMRGYSLHLDKKRNNAIKIYQECLDYFGDNPEIASISLYFMGVAHIENGEVKEGLECMVELAEDKELQKHPLVAGALMKLADNYSKNGEGEKAISSWKQVARDFSKVSPQEAQAAVKNVTGNYVLRSDYTGYMSWLVNKDNSENLEHLIWVYENVWSIAYQGYTNWWNAQFQLKPAEKVKGINAFMVFFMQSQPTYQKANKEWNYLDRLVTFNVACVGGKERDDSVDVALAFIASTWKDNSGVANEKYSWVSDKLRDVKQFSKAAYCLAKITDPFLRLWKEQELLQRQGEFAGAAVKVQELIAAGDKAWTERGEGALASLYHQRLGKYDEAIKIYQQMNKPPSTLWSIQDCQKRKGDLESALNTLTEIENFFKSDAPNAAYQKAQYYHEAGDRKNAISQGRRIMKLYPTTPASSRAHQLLEQYGIATGGGVVDED